MSGTKHVVIEIARPGTPTTRYRCAPGAAPIRVAEAPELVLVGEPGAPLPNPHAPEQLATAGRSWRIGGPGAAPLRFPPLDTLDASWARDLELLPGVDLAWSSLVEGTPFGDVGVSYWVHDGRVTKVEDRFRDDLDVWFRFDVWKVIATRAEETSVAETIGDGGDFSGDLDAALLLAGLQESAPWREARRISPNQVAALRCFERCWVGGHLATLAGR